jgi:hypothetical protein
MSLLESEVALNQFKCSNVIVVNILEQNKKTTGWPSEFIERKIS